MKKITDLSKPEVGSIARIFRAHGTDAARVSRTAAQFDITESDARALATACTTTAPVKPAARTITESAPALTAGDARKAYLEGKQARRLEQAEVQIMATNDPVAPFKDLSTQHLEALAADWA
jgi:hypothetical protein